MILHAVCVLWDDSNGFCSYTSCLEYITNLKVSQIQNNNPLGNYQLWLPNECGFSMGQNTVIKTMRSDIS